MCKKIFFVVLLFSACYSFVYSQSLLKNLEFENSPIGFASVNGWGQNGTTGGEGGKTVIATNEAEFLNYIASPDTLIILVKDTIKLTPGTSAAGYMHSIASNKSIIGIGSNATIMTGGLNIGQLIDDNIITPPANAVHNIIIRNLSLRGSGDDAINVQMFAHHIWIDHNDITGARDGLIDIKRGSNFITVSWNYCHHHNKTWLLGRDNADSLQDIGRLKVTYHHNFCDSTKTRTPRVRYGEPVHIFNNYYTRQNYAVASTDEAGVVVEGNYFQLMDNPLRVDFDGEPLGKAIERNNYCDSTDNPMQMRGTVEEPSLYYSYTLDKAIDIPAITRAGAGVGKITAPNGIASESLSKSKTDYVLCQNYPNPFNPSTIISYELNTASRVKCSVLNMLGEEIAVLVNNEKPAGKHQVLFSGIGLPSGMYLCQMQIGNNTVTKKMLLLK